MNNKIIVRCHAQLKDYFPSQFEMEMHKANFTVQQMRDVLEKKNPKAAKLLSSCRIAVDEEICNSDFLIDAGSVIDVLPPSSGG